MKCHTPILELTGDDTLSFPRPFPALHCKDVGLFYVCYNFTMTA